MEFVNINNIAFASTFHYWISTYILFRFCATLTNAPNCANHSNKIHTQIKYIEIHMLIWHNAQIRTFSKINSSFDTVLYLRSESSLLGVLPSISSQSLKFMQCKQSAKNFNSKFKHQSILPELQTFVQCSPFAVFMRKFIKFEATVYFN